MQQNKQEIKPETEKSQYFERKRKMSMTKKHARPKAELRKICNDKEAHKQISMPWPHNEFMNI